MTAVVDIDELYKIEVQCGLHRSTCISRYREKRKKSSGIDSRDFSRVLRRVSYFTLLRCIYVLEVHMGSSIALLQNVNVAADSVIVALKLNRRNGNFHLDRGSPFETFTANFFYQLIANQRDIYVKEALVDSVFG